MSHLKYFDTHSPKCMSCFYSNIYTRKCTSNDDLIDYECICCYNQEECGCKSYHYCCCETAWDTSTCKATRGGHDCICRSRFGEDCRADEHEWLCESRRCQAGGHVWVCSLGRHRKTVIFTGRVMKAMTVMIVITMMIIMTVMIVMTVNK